MMAYHFTKEKAEALATMDKNYTVRAIRKTDGSVRYGVWCGASEHWVEFDVTEEENGGHRQ